MLKELIEQEAHDNGVTLINFAFKTDIKAAYYRTDGSLAVAAVNSAIEDPYDWNVQALHEIKHHESCVYDLTTMPEIVQDKYEILADRLMLRSCMSLDMIIDAYRAGATSIFYFSEHLEITETFFRKGLELYLQICGLSTIYKGFVITWNPFSVKKQGAD
jgi:hypothetical protein